MYFFTETDNPLPLEGKLSHGRSAEPLPFVAALYLNFKHYASGILISEMHILTVASRLLIFFASPRSTFATYFAVLGPYNLIESHDRNYFHRVDIHSDYNTEDEKSAHNIGLLTVLFIAYR